MKEVTAIQSPAGTAVNTVQVARRRQVGGAPSAAGEMTALPLAARQAVTPMQSASSEKPADQRNVCVFSVKNGSIANG